MDSLLTPRPRHQVVMRDIDYAVFDYRRHFNSRALQHGIGSLLPIARHGTASVSPYAAWSPCCLTFTPINITDGLFNEPRGAEASIKRCFRQVIIFRPPPCTRPANPWISLAYLTGGQRFPKYRSLSPFILTGQPVWANQCK